MSLKKGKSGYMNLIPICGPPEGSTNSGNTSNDSSHNMPLQEKQSKLISYWKNISVYLLIKTT